MLLHKLAVTAVATATQLLPRDDEDWQDANENSNCVSAVPGHNGNVPVSACNSYYNYDPQFAPAVAVAVLFGIFTGIHIFEGIVFKKRFTWVLIMACLWETIGFILHALGTKDQQQVGYATAWNILFLLAPLWINAFAYMTFARMVYYWHPEGRVAGLPATAIAKWFVLADIVSFIVQGAGGVMTSPGSSPDTIKIGLNIYIGGMALQEFFIVVFLGLMIAFQIRCNRAQAARFGHNDMDAPTSWKPLLFSLYAVLAFITVRIIFRLVEFTGGVTPDNPLPFHEEYTYALDCFPMMAALLILAIFHPGRYLIGPDSEFPRLSRKEKKAAKQEKKAVKQEKKEARKHAKKYGRGTEDSEGAMI